MQTAPILSNAANRWQQHILDQQRSGRNISAYCREHKLTSSQFFAWRRKLKLTDHTSKTQRFVPVTLAATLPMVEVTLPNGIVVKLPIDTEVSLVSKLTVSWLI